MDPSSIKQIKNTLRGSIEDRFEDLFEQKVVSVQDMNFGNKYLCYLGITSYGA